MTHYLQLNEKSEKPLHSEKILELLKKIKGLVEEFPKENCTDKDLQELADTIKVQYKKVCALMKIPSKLPYPESVSF